MTKKQTNRILIVVYVLAFLFVGFCGLTVNTSHQEEIEAIEIPYITVEVQEHNYGIEPVIFDDITILKQEQQYLSYHVRKSIGSSLNLSESRITYTEEELDLLERLVQCEAGSELNSYDLRLITASAIINRVEMDYYPDNLHDMIYQVIDGKFQFEPVYTGWIETVEQPSEEVKQAVQEALIRDHSEGSWAFYNPTICGKINWFETLEFVIEIENVKFYR